MKTLLLILLLMVGCSGEPEVTIIGFEDLSVVTMSPVFDVNGSIYSVKTTTFYEVIDTTIHTKHYGLNWNLTEMTVIIGYEALVCSTAIDTICYEQKECKP